MITYRVSTIGRELHSYLGYIPPAEYRLKRYTEDCTGTYE